MERLVYNLFLVGAYPALAACFFIQSLRSDKFSGTLGERFAFYGEKKEALRGRRTIWLHAVSVGEAVGAIPLVRVLLGEEAGRRLVITTTTKGGMEILRKTFGDRITAAYFPFDFPWVVRRALKAFHPDALILMETEIWPNLIGACARGGIPVLLLNGRVSDRMARAGGGMRRLYRGVFSMMEALGMQTGRDADRIIALGAPKRKVHIVGNMKFDGIMTDTDAVKLDELRRLLAPEKGPILIAGSTHPGEEEIVLAVFRRLREKIGALQLAIAPRHIERAGEVAAIVEKHGFIAVLRSLAAAPVSGGERPVVVLDTIGELRYVYSIATLCFVGGSLVERGGHNILEPAACGKAPFYGPYTMNFSASVLTLEQGGGGIQVADTGEFSEQAFRYLSDEEYRGKMDGNALEVVRRNSGATARAYDLFREFVK